MYIDKKLKRVARVTITSAVLTAAEKLPKIKTSKMIKTITDQTARVRYLLFILIPHTHLGVIEPIGDSGFHITPDFLSNLIPEFHIGLDEDSKNKGCKYQHYDHIKNC